MPPTNPWPPMRILIDENFPADFAELLSGEIHTVHGLGWSGIKNGELLRRAAAVCDVFLTLDRNLEFQQNVSALSFGVVVVRSVSNRVSELRKHVRSIEAAVKDVRPGEVKHAGA